MVSGIGAAATIRMGNQLGKRDIPMLRTAGQSLFHLTLAMMVVTMCLFIGFRNLAPEFYPISLFYLKIFLYLLELYLYLLRDNPI